MFDMFQASLAGELYDPEKWAKFYKPYGMDSTSDISIDIDDTEQVRVPVSKPAVSKPVVTKTISASAVSATSTKVSIDEDTDISEDDDDDAPVAAPIKAVDKPSTANKTPKEIIEMLKNRSK
jgi:hypothetical protein